MAPKDIHVLIPISCEYVTLDKRMWQRALRSGGVWISQLGGAKSNHTAPQNQSLFHDCGQRCDHRRMVGIVTLLLSLKLEERSRSQRTQMAFRSWKKIENEFSLRDSRKEYSSANTLILV